MPLPTYSDAELKGKDLLEIAPAFGSGVKFHKPEQLLHAVQTYTRWSDLNPLVEEKPMSAGGQIHRVPMHHPRPYTFEALAAFIGVHASTLHNWANPNHPAHKPDMAGIVERTKQTFFDQKFSFACAGLMNANLIGRNLGLADRTEAKVEHTGEVQSALTAEELKTMTLEEKAAALKELLNEGKDY